MTQVKQYNTTYLCINIIPIIAPTKIPIEKRIIDIPMADIKKDTYIGFLLNLKIPVLIIFLVGMNGAGDSLLE